MQTMKKIPHILKAQIDSFKKAIKYFELEGLRFKYKHISASAGALSVIDPEFNAIRPGIAIYGLSPVTNAINDLKPVLDFESTIVQTKFVSKGEYIGYSRTYKAKERYDYWHNWSRVL